MKDTLENILAVIIVDIIFTLVYGTIFVLVGSPHWIAWMVAICLSVIGRLLNKIK